MAAPISFRLYTFSLLCLLNLSISEQIEPGSPIENVDSNILDELTQQHEHILALFHDGVCETDICKRAKNELEFLLKATTVSDLKVVTIHSPAKAKELHIPAIPNLIFFHNGSPNIYPAGEIEADLVREWIERPEEELITSLDDTNFEHITQAATGATTGDWLIVFYTTKCSGGVLPSLRSVATRLKGRVVVGRVDMAYSPQLVNRFKLTDCPMIKFFRAGNMYDFNLTKYNVQTILKFAEGWYRNSRKSRVPSELTPFDNITEYIANALKEALEENHLVPLLIGGGVTSLVITLLIAYCCSSSQHKKQE